MSEQRMKKFIFVARHEPRPEQIRLAAEQSVELISIGDLDAFDPELPTAIRALAIYHQAAGIVAVHPLIAVTGCNQGLDGGFFRNAKRAPVGEVSEVLFDRFVVFSIPSMPGP